MQEHRELVLALRRWVGEGFLEEVVLDLSFAGWEELALSLSC